MRKISMPFLLFLAFAQVLWGQNATLYESGNIVLKIDLHANQYSCSLAMIGNVISPNISEGKVLFEKNTITCIDTETKEKVVFKQIDKYRLVVINISSIYANKIVYPLKRSDYFGNCFKMNEIVYAAKISDSHGKVFALPDSICTNKYPNTFDDENKIRKIGYKHATIVDNKMVVADTLFGINTTVYETDSTMLEVDSYTKKYYVWVKQEPAFERILTISEGKVLFNKDTVTCVDTKTKEQIVFKQIDKYRLIVLNLNFVYANSSNSLGHYFKTNEIVYSLRISDSHGKPVETTYWKNGKRYACWNYYSDKGVDFVIYGDNGEIVNKYFKTYKEIQELDEEFRKHPSLL